RAHALELRVALPIGVERHLFLVEGNLLPMTVEERLCLLDNGAELLDLEREVFHASPGLDIDEEMYPLIRRHVLGAVRRGMPEPEDIPRLHLDGLVAAVEADARRSRYAGMEAQPVRP